MTRKAADDAERNTPELGGDNTLYNKAFQDTLSSMKCVADTAKQVSINKQEAAERAIKAASDAKIAAEMTRKAADDAERNTPELGGVMLLPQQGVRRKTEYGREKRHSGICPCKF
ncbi:hypothetical protein [Cardinium endosymbiont of Dermatophagoides farinae]|uniref:hypothetical protein n=1 Tax=Cardinium endosymbiont of Dermatophagoides farinae TaxID=2597823 RepID=UPI00118260B0|nr:hypothetical protein [Cardinium endosymbiont of Dermatophagoides farinae]TSJ80093.1 hypothetical protein FPG78_06405 [Cardinium endosymbiont of Dermatophagoides farinae]